MRESDEFEPIFLAKAGPPMSSGATEHSASPFAAVTPDDPNQYFFHTGQGDFDFLFGSARRKELITRHFRDFLLAYRPDVVHFQHTYLLGYELIREVRNTLPHVPILYTLHEYLPI